MLPWLFALSLFNIPDGAPRPSVQDAGPCYSCGYCCGYCTCGSCLRTIATTVDPSFDTGDEEVSLPAPPTAARVGMPY